MELVLLCKAGLPVFKDLLELQQDTVAYSSSSGLLADLSGHHGGAGVGVGGTAGAGVDVGGSGGAGVAVGGSGGAGVDVGGIGGAGVGVGFGIGLGVGAGAGVGVGVTSGALQPKPPISKPNTNSTLTAIHIDLFLIFNSFLNSNIFLL